MVPLGLRTDFDTVRWRPNNRLMQPSELWDWSVYRWINSRCYFLRRIRMVGRWYGLEILTGGQVCC